MKQTTKELAEILAQLTVDTTDMYFASGEHKTLDKQLWAFLHIGFIGCLKLNGYSEEECDEVINLTQELLLKMQNEK